MEVSTSTARVFRFGVFELDSRSGELRKHGVKIRLPDQSFQILQVLLDRPGELVTREELQQRLWTSDTFVDFDVGLNSAIRKLRDALGDAAENPRFVETLPRRGYRFIASVTPDKPDQLPEPASSSTEVKRARVRSRWIAGALLLTATIAMLALAYERGWLERMRTGTRAGQIRSLAVLPFENLTGDSAQDYFVDGMTEALTTDLARVGGLDVISGTSARQYKNAKKLLPAIGKELNVDALLEGSVMRSGQEVRITAQLIHAATDRHVWAQKYEGELKDVIALQQQIVRAVASAIQGRIASPSPVRTGHTLTVNPAAYDAYLKGISVGGRVSYEGFRNAVGYFEEAIARQPDFAEAHAALAQAQHQFVWGGPLSPRETMPKAAAAARKAIELDETLPQPHQTLGAILQQFYWQWEEGDKEFRRARALNAHSAQDVPAGVQELIRSRRFEEAIALSKRARDKDPRAFNSYINVATAYRAAGQHEQAVAEIYRALQINPRQTRANFQLGITFMFMGRLNDAIRELETAAGGENPRMRAYLGYAYAAADRPLEARRILKELQSLARQQYVSSFGIALIHDALGEKQPALAAFEQAYQDRAVEFSQMTQYPPFRTIASEPRYHALMKLIGLPR
jgi:TolB-like protein/DNA-binding winged helix-turn-helix (wHTH) protein